MQLPYFVLCSDYYHTHFEKVTAMRNLARAGVATRKSIIYTIFDSF